MKHLMKGTLILSVLFGASWPVPAQEIQINVPLQVQNLHPDIAGIIFGCTVCGYDAPVCEAQDPNKIASHIIYLTVDADREISMPDGRQFSFSQYAPNTGMGKPLPGKSLTDATHYRCFVRYVIGDDQYVPGAPDAPEAAQTAPGTPLVTDVRGSIGETLKKPAMKIRR